VPTWATPGAKIVGLGVKVKEYKGKTQYVADDVRLDEESANGATGNSSQQRAATSNGDVRADDGYTAAAADDNGELPLSG
jgi:hypothetical protein